MTTPRQFRKLFGMSLQSQRAIYYSLILFKEKVDEVYTAIVYCCAATRQSEAKSRWCSPHGFPVKS